MAIVNIGAEEEKGNALVKETFPLLKACKDINFIGSIEARDIPAGVCGCDRVRGLCRKCDPEALRRSRQRFPESMIKAGHDGKPALLRSAHFW